jgi:hypothetical protein
MVKMATWYPSEAATKLEKAIGFGVKALIKWNVKDVGMEAWWIVMIMVGLNLGYVLA